MDLQEVYNEIKESSDNHKRLGGSETPNYVFNILQRHIDGNNVMETVDDGKKYKVKVGDPFGGYWTAGENLSLFEANKLCFEESMQADYFTTAHIEDENGKMVH